MHVTWSECWPAGEQAHLRVMRVSGEAQSAGAKESGEEGTGFRARGYAARLCFNVNLLTGYLSARLVTVFKF